MNKFVLLATAAAALASMPAQAATNLVVNGGFEAPAIATYYVNYGPGSTAITGWTVDAFANGIDNVDIVDGNFTGGPSPAAEGSQFLDLVGFGTQGSIFQTIATVVGQQYELSFAYSHNLFGGSTSEVVQFAAYDVLYNNQLVGSVTHSTGSPTNLDWQTYTGTFVAVSTATNIGFATYGRSTNAGGLIDAVSVVAVPEPATWAMMIGGFALAGAAMRRRKAVVSFA